MKFKRVICMGMAAVLAYSNLPQITVCAQQIQEETGKDKEEVQEPEDNQWELQNLELETENIAEVNPIQVMSEEEQIQKLKDNQRELQNLELKTENVAEVNPNQVTSKEEDWYGNFKYKKLEDGTLSIIGYKEDGVKEVIIPDKIEGKKVTVIGGSAFYWCSGLSSIRIPESVTSIGTFAFSGCSSLSSIHIPKGVVSIGDSAFFGCSSLKEIVVDKDNKTYASQNGILYNKDKTELICCPAGKTGKAAIPKGVTSIRISAFYGCSNLSSISIPEDVTSIGNGAFSGCSSLSSIHIPAGVTSIGPSIFTIFSGCSSLKEIVVDKDNKTYVSQNGILYNKDKTELICCPAGKTGKIAIPKGATSIRYGAFSGCSSLSSINIPKGVTSIGGSAFEGCSSLSSINIPEGVTSIGPSAFKDCSSLSSIRISKNVTSIGPTTPSTFSGCSSLKEIVVNEDNKTYASKNGILYNKDRTELICCPAGKTGKVAIPKGVTSIGNSAFSGCSSLNSIRIPEGVTSIGNGAFSECSSLSSIRIPEGVISIGDSAFWRCSSLSSIHIPEGVMSIGGSAFSICSSLKEIVVNEKNKTYASQNGILYNKDGTTLICCPAGKTGKVAIPKEVTSIGSSAFLGCSGLSSIHIPAGVTSIEYGAFFECSSLKEIVVDKDNKTYASKNGILYNKNSTTLICCPAGKTGKIAIPEGVASIETAAFFMCSSLSSISIPASVTFIETTSFASCSNDLTLIVTPDSYAETYAKNNYINYRYKKCTHTYTKKVTPATTKKNGSITQICSKCGAKKGKATVIYAAKNIKLSKTSFIYNNKVQKPSVTVKDSKGKALKKNKDYTVTYPKNPKNVEKYNVTIHLKGNYKGTVTKTFTITPRAVSLTKVTPKSKGFTAKWKKETTQVTGYQLSYSTSKKFAKKATKTADIKNEKTITKTISKLKAKKTYYVRIRTYKNVKGTTAKLYSKWSQSKKVTTKK